MGDPFIDRVLENEKVLKDLSDEQVILLALSVLTEEGAFADGVIPGTKAKLIALSASLASRAGIKF